MKQGQSVCRCGLEEDRNRRAIEVPTWMFEPATCRRLRLLHEPAVSCDALRGMQALLRVVPRAIPVVCYKPSIVPCLRQEVLMRRSMIPARLSQPTLFCPPPERPSFQTLPPEIQAKAIRLLARLLRGHIDRWVVGGPTRQVRDE